VSRPLDNLVKKSGMISAATVERFRGLRRLEVQGFGRVNLVIGKNDCGKTALLEAIMIAEDAADAASTMHLLQGLRRDNVEATSFDRFWLPLFWNQDPERGFSVAVTSLGGRARQVFVRKGTQGPELVTKLPTKLSRRRTSWTLDVQTVHEGREQEKKISATSAGLKLPPDEETGSAWWVEPNKNLGEEHVEAFSALKQAGREAQLLEVLREIDARVSGVELLAPTSTEAELFVRLGSGTPLLPMAMMGDGFQRCFELGVTATAIDWPTLFVDEFDNGLHYSVLEPVWRWLATISAKRDLQVFATTHSEECIQAACRAFTALNDDGLRVIRLDRRDEETVATVYDRALVEAATEMGVEIRG
jgi:AAA domain, putative AbiEii toxin, Type IV TA system